MPKSVVVVVWGPGVVERERKKKKKEGREREGVNKFAMRFTEMD